MGYFAGISQVFLMVFLGGYFLGYFSGYFSSIFRGTSLVFLGHFSGSRCNEDIDAKRIKTLNF